MEVRNSTMDDLPAIAAVEAACFPAAEAATARNLPGGWHTMQTTSGCCLRMGQLAAFVDGFCTDTPDLTDAMIRRCRPCMMKTAHGR